MITVTRKNSYSNCYNSSVKCLTVQYSEPQVISKGRIMVLSAFPTRSLTSIYNEQRKMFVKRMQFSIIILIWSFLSLQVTLTQLEIIHLTSPIEEIQANIEKIIFKLFKKIDHLNYNHI